MTIMLHGREYNFTGDDLADYEIVWEDNGPECYHTVCEETIFVVEDSDTFETYLRRVADHHRRCVNRA